MTSRIFFLPYNFQIGTLIKLRIRKKMTFDHVYSMSKTKFKSTIFKSVNFINIIFQMPFDVDIIGFECRKKNINLKSPFGCLWIATQNFQ